MKKNTQQDAQWAAFFDEMREYIQATPDTLPKPYYDFVIPSYPVDEEVLPALNNVLVIGERGTGKELLAHQIAQFWHKRTDTPALPVQARFNCAGWSEELARSELFGYAPHAFTGASKKAKEGLVSRFPILFFDEIHRLPQSIQAMLLRFIQFGEYQPIGDIARRLETRPRIIAAVQPAALENTSTFLPDLRDRFEHTVELQSLNEAPQLIAPLFVIFLYKTLLDRGYTTEQLKNVRICEGALVDLLAHNWKGNIRELHNFTRNIHITERNAAEVYFPLEEYSIALKSAMRADLDSAVKNRRAKDDTPPEVQAALMAEVPDYAKPHLERMRGSDECWHEIFRREIGCKSEGHTLLDVWKLPLYSSSMYTQRLRDDTYLRENHPEKHKSKWEKVKQRESQSSRKLTGKALHDRIASVLEQTNGNVSETARIIGCTPKTVRAHRK